MELLSKANFLISSRLHPIVLASLSATPFFALGWEYKLDEISSMLCSKTCHVKASELNNSVEALILERMRERKELGNEIAKNVSFLQEQAQKNLEILRKSIQEWGYNPG